MAYDQTSHSGLAPKVHPKRNCWLHPLHVWQDKGLALFRTKTKASRCSPRLSPTRPQLGLNKVPGDSPDSWHVNGNSVALRTYRIHSAHSDWPGHCRACLKAGCTGCSPSSNHTQAMIRNCFLPQSISSYGIWYRGHGLLLRRSTRSTISFCTTCHAAGS